VGPLRSLAHRQKLGPVEGAGLVLWSVKVTLSGPIQGPRLTPGLTFTLPTLPCLRLWAGWRVTNNTCPCRFLYSFPNIALATRSSPIVHPILQPLSLAGWLARSDSTISWWFAVASKHDGYAVRVSSRSWIKQQQSHRAALFLPVLRT
jgi:hypothetical protein